MTTFYVSNPAGAKAYIGPSKMVAFITLPCGAARQPIDTVQVEGKDWFVFVEGKKTYFVQAADVVYNPIPTIPADIVARLQALENWARGIGFRF